MRSMSTMKKHQSGVLVLFFCLLLLGCGKSDQSQKQPADEVITNEVSIIFKATNPVMKNFNKGVKLAIKSAFARDEGKILTINLSNMETLSCDNEFPEKGENQDFVLSIMVRKGDEPLAVGDYNKLGIMFSTKIPPYYNNSVEGVVNILKIDDAITARFKIKDERIILTGGCIVPKCPAKE